MKLYNTLSRTIEEFKPIKDKKVGMYTCGPTVYNFAHIGNLRTYIFEDILYRVLKYNGYKVTRVMNITDVGHLTGDRDMGVDKLEKGAAREGKSAWDIAEFYTQAFKKDLAALDILEPDIWCKATDNIPEQIEMIKTLETKGYTYKTSDGIYFDTSKFKDYTKLSHQKLADLQEGARVEINEEKRNPTDFALWKFSPKDQKRQMEWASPWGVGFPGWHIECSAMSLKYLGSELDIHCGGIDHIAIHHTNEIAQSEAATGKKFFNYWIHGAFLNIAGGKKMAKSEDNFLTLENVIIKSGLNPLAYRYASFLTHYGKPMEYNEEGIQAAQNGLDNLINQVIGLGNKKGKVSKEFKIKFTEVINDDLNMPQAIAVVQELLRSDLNDADKLATILDFDQVLGLGLDKVKKEKVEIPKEVQDLVKEREEARKNKDWGKSDELRDKISELGFVLEDTSIGLIIKRVKN
jgi:cysteinyl-tRNA synthetase